jgi:hypothetical protein
MAELWTKFVEQLAVIRKAPLPHVLAMVIWAALIAVGLWAIDSGVMALYERRADLAEDNLQRYKVLVGEADPPDRTALTEMSNSDLKAFATRAYTGIRELSNGYRDRLNEGQQALAAGRIDEEAFARSRTTILEASARDYEAEFRVDAQMIRRELRNRLPRQVASQIVTTPEMRPLDPRGANVQILDSMPTTFSFGIAEVVVREIEELAKLLPED